DTAIGEMLGLGLTPAAEIFTDGIELHRREALLELRRNRRIARAIVVLRLDLLRRRRVEKLEIGLGNSTRAALVGIAIDEGDRGLGEDRRGGINDLELVGAELVEREVGLVLPGEQDIADAALREGEGRAARAGIEHRHMLIERLDETLGARRARAWKM